MATMRKIEQFSQPVLNWEKLFAVTSAAAAPKPLFCARNENKKKNRRGNINTKGRLKWCHSTLLRHPCRRIGPTIFVDLHTAGADRLSSMVSLLRHSHSILHYPAFLASPIRIKQRAIKCLPRPSTVVARPSHRRGWHVSMSMSKLGGMPSGQ